MSRPINRAGLDLIRNSEGVRLQAYPDPGTNGDPWTIGYGHTGPEVHKGMVITQLQADNYLAADLMRFEDGVSALVTRKISDNQFAALVSFAYNLGLGNLKASTLLKCTNAGNFADAALEFGKWTKAAGKVLPGLVKRRAAEAALFSTVATDYRG